MIKRFVLICFIYFCLSSVATAIEMGLYLSPKFIFSVSSLNVSNRNVNNLFIGAGASIGYNFNVIHQQAPVRLEFEYLYRDGLNRNLYSDSEVSSMNSHTFLFGAYYDFNFFEVDYNSLEESKIYRDGKRHLMTVYLGILFGADLEQYILNTIVEKIGMVSIANYYNKSKFNFGLGLGFAVNITTLITADIGYRILLDTDINTKHDIIMALRFNF